MKYVDITVAEYLWTRCRLLGSPYNSNRLNALPGDFALPLFHGALKSGMDYVSSCNEQEAAAAASGDARWYSYGFMLVTYGVGMKNVLGYISMDVSEEVRTLYVSGAADPEEHTHRGVFDPGQNILVHHYEQNLQYGEKSNQYKAIELTGIPCAYIYESKNAAEEIDKVLLGMEMFSCPGYLEVSRSVSKAIIKVPEDKLKKYSHYWKKDKTISLIDNFSKHYQDKITETANIINKSKNPVIVIGNLVRRYEIKEYVQALAEKTGAVITSTQLGIGVFSDNDPLYAGVYGGGMSSTEDIIKAVEGSDCVIAIGTSERETNAGLFTAKINPKNLISITPLSLYVNNWKLETGDFWNDSSKKPVTASRIEFISFLKALSNCSFTGHKNHELPTFAKYLENSYPVLNKEIFQNTPLNIDLMINLLNNHFIHPDMRLASDFGDCALMSTRLRMGEGIAASSVDGHMNTGFGFLFGAQPQKNESPIQSLLLIGDGAVNMNLGGFLSLKAREIKGATIIILYDNCYKTLYLIDKTCPNRSVYNLSTINYENLSQVTEFGESFNCQTGGEFLQALDFASKNKASNTLIIANLDKNDCSPPLKSLTSSAGKLVQK